MARTIAVFFRPVLLVLAILLSGPALAQQLNPLGVWEPDNKESLYEFSYCGANGDRLCAMLTWIQEDKKDARNVKYLNTYMFKDARQTRLGHWSGTVTLEGFNIGGTVTQTDDNTMQLRACVLFVFCEDIRLTRVD
ncbi:MAG TPA: hypothetical protein VNS12_08140 [Pelagibacterium sp.]|uniref:hypothetical protein n=1 Tax=Pelagibacterium sp. TaxID=1967288 RepID=UPI002B5F9C7D|nr:hypothetical protein [Pelagibacterium sp.]HWJ88023.1 hypothetical protein [Pelagibacterium sp.]